MPFVLLDDGYHSNKKVKAAGIPAAGLYAIALSYCGDEVTDGYIPRWWLEGRAGRYKRHLKDLIDNQLMVEIDPENTLEIVDKSGNFITIQPQEKGYFIPDFVQHNLSSVEVAARRREKSAAGKKGAVKRWGPSSSHNGSHSTGNGASEDRSDGTDDGYARGYAPPAPTPSTERSTSLSTTSGAHELSNDDQEQARQQAWLERSRKPDVRSPQGFYSAGVRSGSWPDPFEQEVGVKANASAEGPGAVAAMIRNGVLTDRVELEAELEHVDVADRAGLVAQFELAAAVREGNGAGEEGDDGA